MRQVIAVFCAVVFSAVFIAAAPVAAHQRPPSKPSQAAAKESPKFLGSKERLARQNAIADLYGLSRAEKDEDIPDFVVKNGLVPVPNSGPGYSVTAAERFRYLLPEALAYLEGLSSAYWAKFGEPLKITSLLRTREHQLLLVRWRISDADCRIDSRCSTHLTGAAFDISKVDIYRKAKAAEKLRWLRARLAADWQAGRIDPIDEITNFHIMVIPPADKNPN